MMYIFTRMALVQRWKQDGNDGMLWAEDIETARELCRVFKRQGISVSPALIGSLAGETVDGHIRAGIKDYGDTGAWQVLMRDGNLCLHWHAFGVEVQS